MNAPLRRQPWSRLCACLIACAMLLTNNASGDDGPRVIRGIGSFLSKITRTLKSHLPHESERQQSRSKPRPPLRTEPLSSRETLENEPDRDPVRPPRNSPILHPSVREPQTKKQPSQNTASTLNKPKDKQEPDANTAANPKTGHKDILTATRTNKPGRVKSPHPPFTELDVSGMASGSLARDPTTDKTFRLP